jgi:hypothetical protein
MSIAAVAAISPNGHFSQNKGNPDGASSRIVTKRVLVGRIIPHSPYFGRDGIISTGKKGRLAREFRY